MTLSPEQMRLLLHPPSVVAAITSRAQDIADTANSMAEHVGPTPAARTRGASGLEATSVLFGRR